MLQLEQVEASYGHIQALKGIHMTVPKGKLVALIGANGAGKSTVMKTTMGLVPCLNGTIRFDGHEVTNKETVQLVQKGMALVPEGRQILQSMTVEENLQLGAYLRKDQEVKRDMEAVYERFPILKERKHQYGGTLSGGQQQMLAIGRALMARPRLLLLDEPSMGLAPLIVEEIFRVIEEIKKEGTTIVLVEQNAKKALAIADYAYVLETGRIVLEGPGPELIYHPDVRKAYLGG